MALGPCRTLAGALCIGLLALAGCGGSSEPSSTSSVAPPPAFAPQTSFGALGVTPRPLGSEPPIAQTSNPQLAALAERFQPTVKMSIYDRFWPVSVAAVLDEDPGGRHTCLVAAGHSCTGAPARLQDLSPAGSEGDYLEYPAKIDRIEEQFDDFAGGIGDRPSVLSHWREDPAALDPYASAQVYFYDAGSHYDYKGVPPGLTALEYWFFYPLNYYPAVVNPLGILSHPLNSVGVTLDFHEGDWEHVTVLLDASGAPQWLWMARHSDEGQAVLWSTVQKEPAGSTHPIIYPALGGHPSYQSCGAHWRAKVLYAAGDFVACRGGLFSFTYSETPLVDLAQMKWACWPGHFGIVGANFELANNFDFPTIRFRDPTNQILVDGPPSPLQQAENKGVCGRDGLLPRPTPPG